MTPFSAPPGSAPAGIPRSLVGDLHVTFRCCRSWPLRWRGLRVVGYNRRRGFSGGESISGIAVDQHLRRGAIEQNHHLSGAERSFAKTACEDTVPKPRFEFLLVLRSGLERRVSRRRHQLSRCPDKSAALPARCVHGLSQVFEQSEDLLG